MSLMMMRAALIARNALPPQYQRVEYLEKGYGQYPSIDTGMIANQNIEVEISFNQTRLGSNENICPFGVSTPGYSNRSIQINVSTNDTLRAFRFGSYVNYDIILTTGTKHVIKVNKNTLEIDNIIYSIQTDDFDSDRNMYIFRSNGLGYGYFDGALRCYYCIIRESGITKRNFIPCRRKSDNKPGMWDTVSKTFFINQGTGADFTLGPDVL